MQQGEQSHSTELEGSNLAATNLPSVPSLIVRRQQLVNTLHTNLTQVESKSSGTELIAGAAATILALGFFGTDERGAPPDAAQSPLRPQSLILENVLNHGLAPELHEEFANLLPAQLATLRELGFVRERNESFALVLSPIQRRAKLREVCKAIELLRKEFTVPADAASSTPDASPSEEVGVVTQRSNAKELKRVVGQLRDLNKIPPALDTLDKYARYFALAYIMRDENAPSGSLFSIYEALGRGSVIEPNDEVGRTMIRVFNILLECNSLTGEDRRKAPELIRQASAFMDPMDREEQIEHLRSYCLNPKCFRGAAYRTAMNEQIGETFSSVEKRFPESIYTIAGGLGVAAEALPDKRAIILNLAEEFRTFGKRAAVSTKGTQSRIMDNLDESELACVEYSSGNSRQRVMEVIAQAQSLLESRLAVLRDSSLTKN